MILYNRTCFESARKSSLPGVGSVERTFNGVDETGGGSPHPPSPNPPPPKLSPTNPLLPMSPAFIGTTGLGGPGGDVWDVNWNCPATTEPGRLPTVSNT